MTGNSQWLEQISANHLEETSFGHPGVKYSHVRPCWSSLQQVWARLLGSEHWGALACYGPWPITCAGTDDSSIGHDAGLQPEIRSFKSIDSAHRSTVEPTAAATTALTFSWCATAPQPAPEQRYAEMLIGPHYPPLCLHPEDKEWQRV